MSFRVEEKIPMTESDSEYFIQSLKAKGGKELFPKRNIHSEYFDTKEFTMYRDSEEGLLPRKKVRLRHYPLSSKIEYQLEKKVSSIEGRYKTATKLSKTNYQKIFISGYFDSFYGSLEKKVSISYSREYFIFKNIRITRDQKIIYQDLVNKANRHVEKDCVVEIKAPEGTPPDFLLKIIASPRRRFSKYCNAILNLNLS